MDCALSDEQKALRDTIVKFARRELNAGAADRDRTQTFPRDLWRKCGDMRLPGLPVPALPAALISFFASATSCL